MISPIEAGRSAGGALSYVHATAVVIRETGVLLLGPSGAGKSSTALALIAAADALGAFARLVGDDRIGLERRGGRLVARAHPAILGSIERRGQGILGMPFSAAVVIGLVVEFSTDTEPPPRFPDEQDDRIMLEGVVLPRMKAMRGTAASDLALGILHVLSLR